MYSIFLLITYSTNNLISTIIDVFNSAFPPIIFAIFLCFLLHFQLSHTAHCGWLHSLFVLTKIFVCSKGVPPLCHQEVSFLTGDFGIAWFLFIIFFFFSFLPCNMKNHEGSIDLSVYLYIYGLSSPCYYKKQACRHLHRPLRTPSNDNIYVEPLTCLKKCI